jgi:hypothetical protein
MHVRLEALDRARLAQRREAFDERDVFGRMSIVPSAAGTATGGAVLRFLPFGIEVDPISTLLVISSAGLRVVDVPAELRPGSSSLPVSGRIISPCLPTAHSMNGAAGRAAGPPGSSCSR